MKKQRKHIRRKRLPPFLVRSRSIGKCSPCLASVPAPRCGKSGTQPVQVFAPQRYGLGPPGAANPSEGSPLCRLILRSTHPPGAVVEGNHTAAETAFGHEVGAEPHLG